MNANPAVPWAVIMTWLCACSGPVDEPLADTMDVEAQSAMDTVVGATDTIGASYTVVGQHPASDAEDVRPGTVIWADLSELLPEGTSLVLTDATGTSVPGETHSFAGYRLSFAPTEQLAPTSSYTATLDWGGSAHTWTFRTSDRGTSVVTLSGLGSVLESNIYTSVSMNVVSPPGGETMVKDIFPLQYIQLFDDDSGQVVDMRVAIGDISAPLPTQLPCQPTLRPDGVSFDNPVIQSEPTGMSHYADLSAMPLGLSGLLVTIQDLTFRISLDTDEAGNWAGTADSMFKGLVDIRDMGLGNVCNTMAGFVQGMHCESCPHDPGIRECIMLWVTDIEVERRENITLAERRVEDIEADPTCGP